MNTVETTRAKISTDTAVSVGSLNAHTHVITPALIATIALTVYTNDEASTTLDASST